MIYKPQDISVIVNYKTKNYVINSIYGNVIIPTRIATYLKQVITPLQDYYLQNYNDLLK